ncbi:hypothetical protein LQ564_23325 [Massilia sp. G4R7]|uniref:PNPLA domain-containing protein n=1 Tax=Massilia phyllostachyos TaxID=2898585 RepID=A0ABS8QBW2_9BURK|nr:hypothetical protein [Massilia phyllostachyos]MCD2519237.1 hypothetical protein [Massilia phyllostachyos]
MTPVASNSTSNNEKRAMVATIRFLIAWLYVLAGLCLIPMLAVALVYMLLGFIPQAQEVLYALTETGIGAKTNRVRLMWIVIAQLVLAMTVWYAARLLCTIDARHSIPSYLRKREALGAVRLAVTWGPRLLGFASAAALSTVLILAAASAVGMDAIRHILIMLLLGPILVSLNHFFPARKWLTMCVVGVVLLLFCVFFVANSGRMVFLLTAETLLPPLLLLALDIRRRWLRRFSRMEHLSSIRHRSMRRRVVTLFSIGAAGALVLSFIPVESASKIGPAAVVLLTISLLVLMLTPLTLLMRRFFFFTPGWPALATLLIVTFLVWRGQMQFGEETMDVRPQPASMVPASLSTNLPQYQFAVNAHGGGLRAALFTGLVLARMDDMTCGRFGEGLVAASGVSGGSLGIAMYLALRQDFVARGGWTCTVPDPARNAQLQGLVAYALGRDHLSPVVAKLAFHDLFFPNSTAARGQALLDSWQAGALASFERDAPDRQPPAVGLARRLTDLTGGIAVPPAVYFNTTDGLTGERAWFSTRPVATFQRMGIKYARAVSRITVGQAVLHSARFPLVSPPGRFVVDNKDHVLLDGGYVDNSGATTLLEFLEANTQRFDSKKLYVLNIDGNPPSDGSCIPYAPPRRELGLELSSLFKVRSANAMAAAHDLRRSSLKLNVVDIQYNLESAFRQSIRAEVSPDDLCAMVNRQRQAPLGWFISQAAQQAMSLSALSGGMQLCSRLNGLCSIPDEPASAAVQ